MIDSRLNFYIDDDLAGKYDFQAPGVRGYEYNVLVYQNSSLAVGTHLISLEDGRPDVNKSIALLDYIVYT
jgi:hypothetical protein